MIPDGSIWVEAPAYSGVVIRSEPNGPIRFERHNLDVMDPSSPHYMGRVKPFELVYPVSELSDERLPVCVGGWFVANCEAHAYRRDDGKTRVITLAEWREIVRR